MDALTYSTARATLADTMDRVCGNHEAIIITRSGQASVVMICHLTITKRWKRPPICCAALKMLGAY